jgi:hypothetical protein
MNLGRHLLGALLLVFVITGCGLKRGYDRAKQARTFADLQVMAARLSDTISKTGDLSEAQAARTIKSVNGGRDAWGNDVVFRSRSRDGRISYVLVSPGSDGVLEHPDLDDYFAQSASDVHDDSRRDIVFRDGEAITRAGK